jgi:hypothetical protein
MKPERFLLLPLFFFAVAVWLSCTGGQQQWSVDSPSGNIRFTVALAENNQLFYRVSLVDSGRTMPVISQSPLGILRSDADFSKGLSFVKALPVGQIDETFGMITGKTRILHNKANELKLTFRNAHNDLIELVIRACDDGVAFRYGFPEKDFNRYTVEEELTGFAPAGVGKAWMQPYDKVTQWSPAYETYYQCGIPIGTPAPSSEGWSFPALFQTTNAWVLLTEAAVDSCYFAAHLNPLAASGIYTIRMPEEAEANGLVPQKPSSVLPWYTPWRVAIIGKDLSAIVESNLVEKLNPPAAIADTGWIKPGRASWSWWSDAASPRNFATLKKFVDLAVTMGWEYSLVDANWDLMEGGTIEQLVQYANSSNIGIWMWYNSGGAHNSVTERPRDIMSDPVKRKEEFKKLAAWGVKGVKVDFFQSDKQDIIKQYFDILKDAADNRIMVNFHGCTLPRGWNRTWPNLLSMEAVRGAECYGFDSLFTSRAPGHNATLAFTRNAVGSMDYTPVAFTNQRFPHITTYGHEMALSVVFESGILHFADRVAAYTSLPPECRSFLKNIPVVWDETRLLAGVPGEYCIMARRKGDTWYLGGINGTQDSRNWNVDLSLLGSKACDVMTITDGNSPGEFVSTISVIKAAEKLGISVLPFGGFVATLRWN